ncbi:NifB/NifX family molybdenum-iron cluster-binding protein [Geomesophilobacter sediminis]|uniref:Dinitrogenase iron-molybdenum cofactor biosynthesis protein n=1 Tax=Geomesophilobacter sediminis TaxID=2798584 RepID=A0A8J7JMS3_9BACT|nr:NifB/NifX family molybdenum-iron cluster-binding protein [Geomesophilobacter sediminis]MBJ6726255.1 dinitrogenase iron-molybdenum cofactor biosynthesis protein [Geomesophilobacter sediminis]
MLFAVATKDGKEVNQHFGHAERFLIYDVEEERVRLVDERAVERYCTFDPDHPMRSHTLQGTADVLRDCQAVVCAMIGEAPQIELARIGVQAFAVEGEIKSVLQALVKVI